MTLLSEPERKSRAKAWCTAYEEAKNPDSQVSRRAVPLQFALRGATKAWQHGWDSGAGGEVSVWANPFIIRGERPDGTRGEWP